MSPSIDDGMETGEMASLLGNVDAVGIDSDFRCVPPGYRVDGFWFSCPPLGQTEGRGLGCRGRLPEDDFQQPVNRSWNRVANDHWIIPLVQVVGGAHRQADG